MRQQNALRRIASAALEEQLGSHVEDIGQAADSLVRQWRRYQGHASLFLFAGSLQLSFTLQENRQVIVTQRDVDVQSLLAYLGLFPKPSQAIAAINLGGRVRFRDRQGFHFVLWYNPRENRVLVRPAPDEARYKDTCLCCSATLRPWERECPCCGFAGHPEQSRP